MLLNPLVSLQSLVLVCVLSVIELLEKFKLYSCNNIFHSKCLKLSNTEVTYIQKNHYTCWTCSLANFSNSMFDSSFQSDISDQKNNLLGNTSNNNVTILSFNARSLKNPKKKTKSSHGLKQWTHLFSLLTKLDWVLLLNLLKHLTLSKVSGLEIIRELYFLSVLFQEG
jgi:hypothetical protein